MKITCRDGQYIVSELGNVIARLPSLGDAMRVAGMEPDPNSYDLPDEFNPDDELNCDPEDGSY